MRRAWLLAALLATGCVSKARPDVLEQASAAARTPSSIDAAEHAPAAHAEAEKLRREADAAYERGDSTAAQILGEHALATYARAFAMARRVKAQRVHDEAKGELDATTGQLSQLAGEQKKADAEASDLEARVKVVREAVPVATSELAEPAREQARLEAARALSVEAKLLCVSARLLDEKAEGLADAEGALASLGKAIGEAKRPAPIDAAMRARAGCLSVLSKLRKAGASSDKASSGDELLASLSKAGGFGPSRDERGVVVTITQPFERDGVGKEAASQLEALGKVAAAHATSPVLLVVHDGEKSDASRGQRRGDAAKKIVEKGRGGAVAVEQAGVAKPVVDPTSKKLKGRNERLEIVFVDRGGA